MFDFASNAEMQLVPLHHAPQAGEHWKKPAPVRPVKLGFFGRFLARLGLLA